MTVPVSGLAASDRALVRGRAVQAAALSIRRAGGLHYTTGTRRWEGIDQHLSAARGQVPAHGDCSSTATWWLWNGLWLLYGKPDTVNGQNWQYGFTGTMLTSGKAVPKTVPWLPGDLLIYGTGPPGKHVAMYLGGGYAASHGSEPGPFKVRWNYRADLMAVRRCI